MLQCLNIQLMEGCEVALADFYSIRAKSHSYELRLGQGGQLCLLLIQQISLPDGSSGKFPVADKGKDVWSVVDQALGGAQLILLVQPVQQIPAMITVGHTWS